MRPESALRTIKLAHTLIWALFAACIVAIPFFVWSRQNKVAGVLIAVVMLEVIVLLVNRMRCPLTDIAARYTEDRRVNFDIYLPLWLAKYNKLIFGALFAVGLVYAAVGSSAWT